MADCALVLQPAINELRLARGHAVLTEAELFTMQIQALGTLLPLPESHAMDSRAAQDQARRYLSAFPVSLLSRSEEHTSELQSLMRSSYAVFSLTTNIAHLNTLSTTHT